MTTKTRQGIILLSTLMPLAYIAGLIGVTIHEVLGHGLSAVLVGGKIERFTIHWDGMGHAYTTLPVDASAVAQIMHLASGVIATTVIGLPLFVWGWLLPSSRWHKLPLIVTGSCIALDGLPYMLFNSLIPNPLGDFGCILLLWENSSLPAFSVAKWIMVFIGGVGTLAIIYMLINSIHMTVFKRLWEQKIPTLRQSFIILEIFVLLPGLPLFYMFDWEQLIAGVGRYPNNLLLIILLVSVTLSALTNSSWGKTIADLTAMSTSAKNFVGLLLVTLILCVVLPITNPDREGTLTRINQIQASLEHYKSASFLYMARNVVNTVSYVDVFDPGKSNEQPLQPVLGEDYNDLSITDTQTEISVETNDGRTISIEFESYHEFLANIRLHLDDAANHE